MFSRLKDLLWPLGGLLLGLLVAPVAIEQYPEVFKDSPWILPLSVATTLFCFVFPFFLHARVTRIYRWIVGGFPDGWKWAGIAVVVALVVGIGSMFWLGGRRLYGAHKIHLARRLARDSKPVEATKLDVKPSTSTLPSLDAPLAPKASKPTLQSPPHVRYQEKPFVSKLPDKSALPSEATPKISLALSVGIMGPSDPEIIVENPSDSLADRILWELVMFRVSDQAFFSFTTQDIGYLKPHSKSPGYSMHLETLPRAPGGDQLRDGDEFIGTLSVDCPTCKGTTLIVSFVWHKSGWFYEVPNGNGGLLLPKGMSKEAITEYVGWLQSIVPAQDRRPILSH